MSKKKATDLQILRNLKKYVDANGFAPSIRELCLLSDIESTSTMSLRLARLERAGFILKEPVKTRTLRVTELGRKLLERARTA